MSLQLVFLNYVSSTLSQTQRFFFAAQRIKNEGIRPQAVLSDSSILSQRIAEQCASVFGKYVPANIEKTLDLETPESKENPFEIDRPSAANFVFNGLFNVQDCGNTIMIVATPETTLVNTLHLVEDPYEAFNLKRNHALCLTFEQERWPEIAKTENVLNLEVL